jgi:hypothetical protein
MKKILSALALFVAAINCSTAENIAVPSENEIQAHNQAIGKALAMATPVKNSIENYRLRTKEFPASNAAAGMNPPATYRNYDVKGIAIGNDGVVEITLTASSGIDGGVIRLTPKAAVNTDPNMIEWTCTSPSFSTIADATGGTCEYTNQP